MPPRGTPTPPAVLLSQVLFVVGGLLLLSSAAFTLDDGIKIALHVPWNAWVAVACFVVFAVGVAGAISGFTQRMTYVALAAPVPQMVCQWLVGHLRSWEGIHLEGYEVIGIALGGVSLGLLIPAGLLQWRQERVGGHEG